MRPKTSTSRPIARMRISSVSPRSSTGYAAKLSRSRGQQPAVGVPDPAADAEQPVVGDGALVVYEQPLAPHPDTTAVALLALREDPANGLVTASLDWLQQRAQTCFAPWSLAWAILALDACRRPTYPLLGRLAETSDPGKIKDNATLAAVSMALDCASGRNIFKVAT